ncbi:hypothetical protein ACB094_07G024700 [Castanea mollissima]
MDSEERQLHLFFLPFLASGHLIPAIDMTKQFALRGLKISIITTPLNASFAAAMLEQPLEKLIQEYAPDCLVASTLFHWTTGVAKKFGIPRLILHSKSFFSSCTAECLRLYEPQKKVSSDTEPFIIPNFPDEIKFTRKQLLEFYTQNDQTYATKMYEQGLEAEFMSFGAFFNSFYALEPAYANFYNKEASISFHECFEWLNSKKPDSVVYVCFGSIANFNDSQLKEIAIGLEAFEQQFIWLVRKEKNDGGKEEWLPDGFKKRVKGKGLIIRGWAPQMMILDHEAVGGFVTHCGWNSTLEGVSARLPMVTWPVFAEQFFNENFVTQILRIGVAVDSIKSEAIEKAVFRIMVGAEVEEIRSRARELGKKAKKVVEECGSSYSDLSSLIEELRSHGIVGVANKN